MGYQPIIYLVDDDETLRVAIIATLRMAGYRVKDYATAEAFLADLDPLTAGCLVTDLLLPGMNGIELQQTMMSRGIRLPILFMTGYGAIHESVQAIKAGAVDFMEKPVSPTTLLQHVEEALCLDRGRRQQESEVLSLQSRFDGLSRREKEVVDLVVEGKTNKEIAQVLSISYRTVEKYRAGAMVKLKVENAVELAKLVQFYAPERQMGRMQAKF